MTKDVINKRYEVKRSLGQGGMGAVYLVADREKDGLEVALKCFRPRSLAGEELELFKQEFLLLSSLHHPNLAEVHDFGVIEESGERFFTTEFIDGDDLYAASAELDEAELYEVITQVCRGLGYIHSRRLIHHDLKPSNLMLRREPKGGLRVKIIDFGLAESLREQNSGAVRGTVSYIAPELARQTAFDHRADLYSLGVTLYHCVTRALPFEGETSLEVLRAHLEQEPTDPREHKPDLPDPIAQLILKLMAKRPGLRPANAEAIIRELSELTGRSYAVETAASALSYVNSGDFIGRSEAFGALKSSLDEVLRSPSDSSIRLSSGLLFDVATSPGELASGAPRLLLVSGEGGIGKSRLLHEFRHHAQLRQVAVAEGEATPERGAYEPICAVFRSLLGLWPGQQGLRGDGLRRRLVRRHGGELARILPELSGETVGESPELLTPGNERLRLFDHMTRCLLDFSRSRPLVVTLHDLQHADPALLSFLEYLARNLSLEQRRREAAAAQGRLLVLVSYRRAPASKLETIERGLLARGEARQLELRRLDLAEVEELVASMLGEGRAPRALPQRLHVETRGNPYFIVELMRSLVEGGALRIEDGSWRLDSDLSELRVPASVREVILERLARLSPPQRAPLPLLASFGHALSARAFASLASLPLGEALRQLEALVGAQILDREMRAEERSYDFAHALVREAVSAELSDDRRAQLHLRCGEFLEREHPDEALKDPGELARHFELGGDPARALSYAVKAANAAHAVHATQRAIALYQRAVGLLPSADDSRRPHLLEQLGSMQALVGDYEAAAGNFQAVLDRGAELPRSKRARLHRQLAEVSERRGDYDAALEGLATGLRELGSELHSTAGAKLLAGTASIYIKRGLYDLAIGFCESGLGLLSGFSEEDETAKLRACLGEARARKGDLKAARRDFELSLQIRRRSRDRLGIAETLARLGGVSMELGELEGAVTRFEQALTLNETLGHRQGVAEAAAYLGRALSAQGDPQRAVSLHRRALSIKERIGDLEGIVISQNDLGSLTLHQGDYRSAARHFARAREVNAQLGAVREDVRALNGQGSLALICGQLEEAGVAAGEALRLATLHELGREQGRAYRTLGLVAHEEAQSDDGELLLTRALTVFGRLEAAPAIAMVTLDMVELFVDRGDVALARMALDKLRPQLQRLGRARLSLRAELCEGQVSAAEGARDDALGRLERTRASLEEINAPELRWWSCYLCGALYETLGRRSEALARYVEGMESLRGSVAGFNADMTATYLSLPRRRRLKEAFRKLRSGW